MESVRCANCQSLQRRVHDLQAENERLRRQLDEATRAGKRQAAPFAKGKPKLNPRKPGRKPGKDYDTKAHRQPPSLEQIDEIHEAPLPKVCPDCGGPLDETHTAQQFQVEIPRKPIHRQFNIHLGQFKLPRPPDSVEEVVKFFESALTPRTRIILFSHITWETGVVLPVKEICELARKHGILTHVDGAHGPGQVQVDVQKLGCNFYATNMHKWLMAPKGTGALFIREEHQERLWAHTVMEQWRNYKLKAFRFSNFGTSNLSVIVGVKAALDFFHALRPKRIYARIHELGSKVRDRLREDPESACSTSARRDSTPAW